MRWKLKDPTGIVRKRKKETREEGSWAVEKNREKIEEKNRKEARRWSLEKKDKEKKKKGNRSEV